MINPPSFAIREILEVTLLIVARYMPEKMKQEQEDGSDAGEGGPSFTVSGYASREASLPSVLFTA